jgi:hypothetical protein
MSAGAEQRAHVVATTLPDQVEPLIIGILNPNETGDTSPSRGKIFSQLIDKPHGCKRVGDMAMRYGIYLDMQPMPDVDILLMGIRVEMRQFSLEHPYPRVVKGPSPDIDTIERALRLVRERWLGWLLPIVFLQNETPEPFFFKCDDELLITDNGRLLSFIGSFAAQIDVLLANPWNKGNKQLLDQKLAAITKPLTLCIPLVRIMPKPRCPVTGESIAERMERLCEQEVVE